LAVVVGVSSYADGKLNLPRGVRNDAEDVARVLADPARCGYASGRILRLLDEQATLGAMREALAWLEAQAGPDDTVIVYFSGHAGWTDDMASGFLCPNDFEDTPERWVATGLGDDELTEALSRIPAKRLLVLLDACHATDIVRMKGQVRGFKSGLTDAFYDRLSQGTGGFVIAAARRHEQAHVDLGANNSIFTGALLEALRGGASADDEGVVWVTDLYKRVAETIDSTARMQTPTIKGFGSFAVCLRGSTDVADPDFFRPTAEQTVSLKRLLRERYDESSKIRSMWRRAGGDVSRLPERESAHAAWEAALVLVDQGGGGDVTFRALAGVLLDDFHQSSEVVQLAQSFGLVRGSAAKSLPDRRDPDDWDDSWQDEALSRASTLGPDVYAALSLQDGGQRLFELANAPGCPLGRRNTLLAAAAARRLLGAFYDLGSAAQQGHGVPPSIDRAKTWWRRGASRGDTLCMLALWRVLKGSDPVEARQFLDRAAEDGDSLARLDRAKLLLSDLARRVEARDELYRLLEDGDLSHGSYVDALLIWTEDIAAGPATPAQKKEARRRIQQLLAEDGPGNALSQQQRRAAQSILSRLRPQD
jgi:TPR repeat protein